MSDQDLKTISIFKSKDAYFKLKEDIKTAQKRVVYANWVWMILLGVLNLLAAIVNAISADSPIACAIAIALSNGDVYRIDNKDLTESQQWSLYQELLNMLKSILFLAWFFYCNHYVATRKVSEQIRLTKLYMLLAISYIVLIGIEIYFSTGYIN